MATRIHYNKGLAIALRNLGSYYAFRPHKYLSFLFYDNALTESRAAGDSISVAALLMNIGIYYQFQGAHTTAQNYLNKALQLAWQLHNDSLRAVILANYYVMNSADTAMLPLAQKALQQSAVLAARYHDKREMLYTQLFLAHEALRAGKVKDAEDRLKKVIFTADSTGLNYLAMYACMQLAGYMVWQQQADSLLYHCKSMEYAVAGSYTGLMLPVTTKLYTYYHQRGDSAHAARYSRLALQVMQQQQEDMQEGEADYLAYSLGDQFIDSLQLQHISQTKRLLNSEKANHFWYYQLIIITVIALLLLVLLLYFIRAYGISRRNAAQLALIQEEIRIKNEALQANDDFKNKLISMIAHDFRTPLYNIVNITGFVDEETLTVTDAAEMILEVEQTAATTLLVFDEILRWMHTQLSGFVYHPKSFVLADMIAVMQQSLQHLLAEKKLQLVLDIPPGTMVLADFEMLQFIHRNFLHNGIKFSPENGVITVKVIRKNGWIEVYFIDEGPGINEVILSRLFSYSSAVHEREHSGKDAGLALIICKDFIDKMNGETGACNNADKGSTFFYRLPEVRKPTDVH